MNLSKIPGSQNNSIFIFFLPYIIGSFKVNHFIDVEDRFFFLDSNLSSTKFPTSGFSVRIDGGLSSSLDNISLVERIISGAQKFVTRENFNYNFSFDLLGFFLVFCLRR